MLILTEHTCFARPSSEQSLRGWSNEELQHMLYEQRIEIIPKLLKLISAYRSSDIYIRIIILILIKNNNSSSNNNNNYNNNTERYN